MHMVIEADIPDGLAQIFTQHLLGFEAAHAGCRFAVRSKTEMPVSETAQTPDIANAELAAAQKRISEQSERIAELYRGQKNSFLSLRTSGDALADAFANRDEWKRLYTVADKRADDLAEKLDAALAQAALAQERG